MDWNVSHAAVAGLAFIFGVGVTLLAQDRGRPVRKAQVSKGSEDGTLPIEVPRQVAIALFMEERRELFSSQLAFTKALATFSVAGMAASAALFATARAAHIVVFLAFMAFFLAFIGGLFPYLEHSKSAIRQFGNAFRTLHFSRHENVKLPIVLPTLKGGGQTFSFLMITAGAVLIAISVAIPFHCSLSRVNDLKLFGAYGENVCRSLRLHND